MYGIESRSILNDLNYFKLCESMCVDIMHDVLEGVGQLEIKNFLNYYFQNNQNITLQELNRRIEIFNYGLIDRAIKPIIIILDKQGNLINQRAMQMECLLRYFPFILVELSESYRLKHKVIMLPMKCIKIFAPVISQPMIHRLNDLISEHHKHYMQQFNANLTPKHHFMVHGIAHTFMVDEVRR